MTKAIQYTNRIVFIDENHKEGDKVLGYGIEINGKYVFRAKRKREADKPNPITESQLFWINAWLEDFNERTND